MVTKKTTKKTTATKSAPKQAAAKATTTTVTRVVSEPTQKRGKLDTKLPDNLISIIIAEVVGTFILTLVALLATAYFALPLYVGLALVVLVLTIGAISGAHVNPAVTFGLWSARKLKTVLVPFYWGAQFLGAIAAIVLLGSLSGGAFTVHFDHFMDFSWSIFTVELVGTAIFLFGLTAVLSRADIKGAGKAFGIGLSLAIGLIATNTLLPYIQSSAVEKHQAAQQEAATDTTKSTTERTYPREVYISGATLNPAVAVAASEKTDSQLQGNSVAGSEETSYSRFSLEVILATLIGAALGANLFLLINFRSKTEA